MRLPGRAVASGPWCAAADAPIWRLPRTWPACNAPLLLVGGRDAQVLALNRRAASHLHATKVLTVVPGATHLCEEPGTLETVAGLAAGWFAQHLLAARALVSGAQ